MWLLLLMVGPYNAAVPKGPTFSFLNYVVVIHFQKLPKPPEDVIVQFKKLNRTLRRCTEICINPDTGARSANGSVPERMQLVYQFLYQDDYI